MIRVHRHVDVNDPIRTRVGITVTTDTAIDAPRAVVFGFPGGGYTRAYFDVDHPDLPGPGQAEYHAARGWVFVACDLVDSAAVRASAEVADVVVASVLERLRSGTLADGLDPIEIATTIGIGHSLGGMQLIHHQGRLRRFDAVAVLGFSAVHTVIPTPDDGEIAPYGDPAAVESAWSGPLSDDIEHLRYAYHWADVPPDLVAVDMSVGFPVRTAARLPPWISATFPKFAATCMAPGVVADEAALIDVPVFVGAGERDVLRDPRTEPAAYRRSRDITLVEVPRCAHMHNFSPQREGLWARLHQWASLR